MSVITPGKMSFNLQPVVYERLSCWQDGHLLSRGVFFLFLNRLTFLDFIPQCDLFPFPFRGKRQDYPSSVGASGHPRQRSSQSCEILFLLSAGSREL